MSKSKRTKPKLPRAPLPRQVEKVFKDKRKAKPKHKKQTNCYMCALGYEDGHEEPFDEDDDEGYVLVSTGDEPFRRIR